VTWPYNNLQAYKHVFTSLSSVDVEEGRAAKSGNAHIHEMTAVTPALIAYITMQVSGSLFCKEKSNSPLKVRFALSSSSCFSRTDHITDSENFYLSLLDVLDDKDKNENVSDLVHWWNAYACLLCSVTHN